VNLFSPDNFGTFLFLVFVVLFLVVLAVVRRRRRKKMLLAANRAYLEGRNFIV
jgi:protein-S-isoprenylcysteine O-methyltransferase Ste14